MAALSTSFIGSFGPARHEEIATGEAIERDNQRHRLSEKILASWGFDFLGFDQHEEVTDGVVATSRQQRATRAWGETRARFTQLGLLKGSLFDHEREVQALFAGDINALQKLSSEPLYVKRSAAIRRLHEGSKAYMASGGRGHNPFFGYGRETATYFLPISHVTSIDSSPTHGLSRVAGMADLKEQLIHEVIGPFKDPELYRRYRVSLPNGILFYGPPGCGKTYIARSLAEELGWSFSTVVPLMLPVRISTTP